MFIVIGCLLLQIPQSSPELSKIIFIPFLTNLTKKCLPIKLTEVGYCIALQFNLSFFLDVWWWWHCGEKKKPELVTKRLQV